MLKKVFSLFLIFILSFSVFSVNSYAFTPTEFDVRAESALLVSLDNGQVLYSKKADAKRYPASLTKIMTALLIIENTKDLKSEKITVSENAIKSLLGTDSSMGGLKAGEVVTAEQMLYILLMSSANEGAEAIAEHYGKTRDEFINMMNERAAKLGMKNTHYVNPHGLHDDDHYTTVNDMYILVKEALKHSIFEEVVCCRRYDLAATNKNPPRTLTTTNLLMLAIYPEYYYKYAEGIKTGFTDEAGRCLVSTAIKDGYSYLCILMKSTAYDSSNNYVRHEFPDTSKLYDWAFDDFEYETLVTKDKIIGEAKVELSLDTDYVSMTPDNDFASIIPAGADESTVTFNIALKQDSFEAPIGKGEKLGTAEILIANEKIGEVNLVAANAVERSWILYAWETIKDIFSSAAMKTVGLILLGAFVLFVLYVIILNNKKRKRRIKKYKKITRKELDDYNK